MFRSSHTRALLCGTALTVPALLATSLSAQQQPDRLTQEETARLVPECVAVVEAYEGATGPQAMERADVLEILRENNPDACVEAEALLVAGIETPEQQQQQAEAEQATEAETAQAEAEAEAQVEAEAEADVAVSEQVAVEEEATIGAVAEVEVPAPNVDVSVPPADVQVQPGAPRITARSGQSNIELRQPEPNIEVAIPEIIVRVEIPAPEVFITTENPEVALAMTEPQVSVEQGQPEVSVSQESPDIAIRLGVEEGEDASVVPEGATMDEAGNIIRQAESDVQIAEAPQARVTIVEGDQPEVEYQTAEPTVSFQGAEPNVSVQMTQQPSVELVRTGEPTVTFETPEQRDQRVAQQQQQQAEQQQQTAGQQEEARPEDGMQMAGNEMTVRDLTGMDVMSAEGQEVGDAEGVFTQDGTSYLLLSEGGFLGLGDDQVAIPLEQVVMVEDGLMVRQMTEAQIEELGSADYGEQQLLGDDETVMVPTQ